MVWSEELLLLDIDWHIFSQILHIFIWTWIIPYVRSVNMKPRRLFSQNDSTTKCGFTSASPYWNWSQGLYLCLWPTDASDVYGSSFFAGNSSTSGLGGWGDPTNDYQVPSGAFSNLHLSYPSTTVRRNFALQRWFAIVPHSRLMYFSRRTRRKNWLTDFKGISRLFHSISSPLMFVMSFFRVR